MKRQNPINQTIANEQTDRQQQNPLESKLLPNKKVLKQSSISIYKHQIYSQMTIAPYSQIFMYQFIGMFIFVYGMVSFQGYQSLESYICISLLIAICISAQLCGANFNVTVTLANTLKKQSKYKWNMFLVYFLAQIIGSTLALLAAQVLFDIRLQLFFEHEQIDVGRMFQIVACQAIGTFILIFFILQLSNPNTTFIDEQWTGYASIVVFVYAARQFAFRSSKNINTSILIGEIGLELLRGQFKYYYGFLWIIGDIFGALIAIVFYDYFYEPIISQQRERRNNELQGMISIASKYDV